SEEISDDVEGRAILGVQLHLLDRQLGASLPIAFCPAGPVSLPDLAHASCDLLRGHALNGGTLFVLHNGLLIITLPFMNAGEKKVGPPEIRVELYRLIKLRNGFRVFPPQSVDKARYRVDDQRERVGLLGPFYLSLGLIETAHRQKV